MTIIPKICTIRGCSKKHNARGLCQMHGRRLRVHGSVATVLAKGFRHGQSRSPEYKSWSAMKTRCLNSNQPGYKNYGGRGIRVCERWLDKSGFTNFLRDMGNKPTSSHSLERIDNEGNYEPLNCKWATRKEQNNNQRIRGDNKSGYPGINYHKVTHKWVVRKQVEGLRKYIGSFDNLQEAIKTFIVFEETKRKTS